MNRIMKNNFFSILIFLLAMLFTFYMTFEGLGAFLNKEMLSLIGLAVNKLSYRLLAMGVNPAFHSLIIEGVCSGIGSVLSFVPTIAVLFFFISLMESCGYMAHIAFILDKYTSKIGLPGEALVPMLIGFGCSVPAIISTRTIPRRRDRLLTIFLIPFISCSAKLPVYTIFISVFFNDSRMAALLGVYLTGIFIAVIFSLILSRTVYRETSDFKKIKCIRSEPKMFKTPSLKFIAANVAGNTFSFVKKAFTVIFMASIIIWFLQSFDSSLSLTDSSENSLLASLGKMASPVFAPLGFSDWRASTALIAGLSAKEAVVSTLSVLTCTVSGFSMPEMISQIFTPLSAFTYMIFCLLYVPCIATMAAIKKETGSIKYVISAILLQITTAWLTAFIIFQAGSFICIVF